MIESLQNLPAYYWLVLTAIAVTAIYITWGRKSTAEGPSQSGS